MIKPLKFIINTISNCLALIGLTYIVYILVFFSQATISSSQISDKKLRQLSKYIRPLKNIYGDTYCSSSSVNYNGKSYTLTNMHCCEDSGDFEPSLRRVGDVLEKILYVSDKADICILTSTIDSKLKVSKKEFKKFESVLLFGYPMGGPLTPRFGHAIVLDVEVPVDYGMYVLVRKSNYISTLTFPGNSGSPVFNKKGEVVNLLYAGPNPIFMYGVTVTNKQINEAFQEMFTLVKP